MIGKLIVRSILACMALVGVGIVTIVACLWLATRPPASSANLMSQSFSKEDFQQLTDDLQQLEQYFMACQVKTNPKPVRSKFDTLVVASALNDLETTVRQKGLVNQDGNIALSQKRINMILSQSDKKGLDGDKVRLKVTDNELNLVGRVHLQASKPFYFTATIHPDVTVDGHLKLELRKVYLGRLRLPVNTLLSLLPNDWSLSDNDLTFHHHANPPHLIVHSPKTGTRFPKLESIRCQDGTLVLEPSR
ncbi:MAG: hypothetical protein KDA87_11555 [Planctomycetales bacterium]|nr:hypothetical protein [Planctomycetales bacterium]